MLASGDPVKETAIMDRDQPRKLKLGVFEGVYVPVCLNIFSIIVFLRFGVILGQIGLLGILGKISASSLVMLPLMPSAHTETIGLLIISYLVDLVTALSLSAVASNGEVKGGGAYYLISRSLGPEFGGSIGLLFYLSQVLNTSLNVVGLIDCLRLNFEKSMPQGYWWGYLLESVALLVCTVLCLAGSSTFAKASNGLLVVLGIAIISIPFSAVFMHPFTDPLLGIDFTGISMKTLRSNLMPHTSSKWFRGMETFRDSFGILFPATSGIFAGASMSGDLRNPSRYIPVGTLWAMVSTFVVYFIIILSMAASTSHASFLRNPNIIQDTNIWAPLILAGECAVTFFSALMGLIGAAKLMQALGRDKLVPGLWVFGFGTGQSDEPLLAVFLTYFIAQLALFANLNQIATLISMGYMVSFISRSARKHC
jgi:solute carrier family 12 (potassium/chloride transporters), member 9